MDDGRAGGRRPARLADVVRPTELPAALRGRPFTVAQARALGVPAHVLDGARFRRPHRGVRVPADLPPSLELSCAAAALALPAAAAFSGWTAVDLCGLPRPDGVRRAAALSVRVPSGTPVPRLSGVAAGEGLRPEGTCTLPESGLRVVHPVDLWCDLAPSLRFVDAVALGDAVRRRWADDARMAAAVRARARSRGVVALREVLASVRYRVDSPMETRLRLLLLAAGIPAPVCGQDLSLDGEWMARPDLSWPAARLAVEYDGDVHRTDRRQWRKDVARKELLEDRGWRVLVLTADDVLRHPERTVARVRAALRAGGVVC